MSYNPQLLEEAVTFFPTNFLEATPPDNQLMADLAEAFLTLQKSGNINFGDFDWAPFSVTVNSGPFTFPPQPQVAFRYRPHVGKPLFISNPQYWRLGTPAFGTIVVELENYVLNSL